MTTRGGRRSNTPTSAPRSPSTCSPTSWKADRVRTRPVRDRRPSKRGGRHMSEQAVIVEFQYGSTDLGPLFALEDELIAAIEAAEVGDYDGNEVATDGSDGSLYMYGPDAVKLADVVR